MKLEVQNQVERCMRKLEVVHKQVGGCLISENLWLACLRKLEVVWFEYCEKYGGYVWKLGGYMMIWRLYLEVIWRLYVRYWRLYGPKVGFSIAFTFIVPRCKFFLSKTISQVLGIKSLLCDTLLYNAMLCDPILGKCLVNALLVGVHFISIYLWHTLTPTYSHWKTSLV